MKFYVRDINISSGGIPIALINKEDALKLDIGVGDRIIIKKNKKIAHVIVDLASSEKVIDKGEIGLFEEVLKELHIHTYDTVDIQLADKPITIKYIKEKLGGEAVIAILDYKMEQATIDRSDGFIDGVMEIAPNAKVVARLEAHAVRDKAMAVMEDIIQAHPDVNVIFGINDDSALGALAAMESAGLTNDNQLIVGFDGTGDAKEAIKNGSILQADVAQDPVAFAKAAVDAALKAINGESLPAQIITDTKVLDASNL